MRISPLLLILALAARPVAAQDLIEPNHLHTTTCASMHLAGLPESREAVAEYRRGFRAKAPASTAAVGDTRQFFTYDFVGQRYVQKNFVLRHVGSRSEVWVETAEFDPAKVTQAVVDELATALETATPAASVDPAKGIMENNTSVFGARPNVNGTGRVYMLIYKIESATEGLTTNGYFAPVNLSPTNPNSNQADIIYINSYPSIYSETKSPTAAEIVSVIAHEDQHLIHARAGDLATFQNEGQSEWAEQLNGYRPRGTGYLNDPTQVNVPLLTWRSGEVNVTNDYARGGLFHSYLSEITGNTALGAISYNGQNGFAAYASALSGTGVGFAQALAGFHVANFVNDRATGSLYGYQNAFRRNVTVANSAVNHNALELEAAGNRSIQGGGAEYLTWVGVENLDLDVTMASGISVHAVLRPVNGTTRVEAVTGDVTFAEAFESVTLVVTNAAQSTAAFGYTAAWEPLPYQFETYRYHAASAFFAELPGDPADATRSQFKGYSVRMSPTYTGTLTGIGFTVNGGSDAIQGDGLLRVSMHANQADGTESSTGQPRFIPGTRLQTTTIPFSDLASGYNLVNLRGLNWNVTGGVDFQLLFEVENASPDARIEFLIDAGSSNLSDPDFYPARSRILLRDSGGNVSWARWSSANNFLIAANAFTEYAGALEAPVFTAVPDAAVPVVLGSRFQLEAEASGVPAPVFQWRLNGTPLAGGTAGLLDFNPFRSENAGTYEVRAVNFAGTTAFHTVTLSAVSPVFELAQNYPNPFNPTTTITFQIPNASRVDVRVYDAMGRLVTTLLDSELRTPGPHTVEFDARGLASGVYYYQVVTRPTGAGSPFRQAKPMLLLK